MTISFSQDDVFPIIRRIIERLSLLKHDFVTHDEIVEAFLTDPSAQASLLSAQKVRPHQTTTQIAANMVAWFSQRITVGASQYAHLFERKKIHGRWAYRPNQKVGNQHPLERRP